MPQQSLSDFVSALEAAGMLVRVTDEKRVDELGPQVVELALQRGLLINAPRIDTLRFMPALTVTRQEIDRMIAILGEVLKEFSIATECGFGRRPAETIPQLLRIHAEIAALP